MKKFGVVLAAAFLIAFGVVMLVRHQKTSVDFDQPLSIEQLQKEADEACQELEKRKLAFDKRFPTEQSKSNNDEGLNSPEWRELMGWIEGWDQAEAQVEEARARTKQGTIP